MQVAIHQSLRVAVTRSRAKVLLRWRRTASRNPATGPATAGRRGDGEGRRDFVGFAGFFEVGFFFGMVVG